MRAPAGGTGPTPMRIRTETADAFSMRTPAGGGASLSFGEHPAGDPLLDAMALSKGRFAVETQGMPTLYLPSWAEVTRVIEDCR